MIWATMSAKHLFGPYVFEGTVNQGIYLITRITDLVCGSVGAFMIVWTCMVSARKCPSSLCNHSHRNPQRSVQRQVDWQWIVALTGAAGVAARSPVILQCGSLPNRM
jgi:hypothetical protein